MTVETLAFDAFAFTTHTGAAKPLHSNRVWVQSLLEGSFPLCIEPKPICLSVGPQTEKMAGFQQRFSI